MTRAERRRYRRMKEVEVAVLSTAFSAEEEVRLMTSLGSEESREEVLRSIILLGLRLTTTFAGEREAPKGANIVMELWVTLEELYVGNFVEVSAFPPVLL